VNGNQHLAESSFHQTLLPVADVKCKHAPLNVQTENNRFSQPIEIKFETKTILKKMENARHRLSNPIVGKLMTYSKTSLTTRNKHNKYD